MTAPPTCSLDAPMHSRDIDGWDDPLSDAGAWIVPAESDAVARFVWIAGIESMVMLECPLRLDLNIQAQIIPPGSPYKTGCHCERVRHPLFNI
jgi:hypothetical protein